MVTARRFGDPVRESLESVYYDTPDRRLSASKAVLRVRRTPGGYVQTLKSGDGLTRNEWEWPVAGQALDLAATCTHAAARAVLDDIPPGELVPMFETRIERTVHRLDGGAIELAIDLGMVLAPDGSGEPISEIELELKSGQPCDLYRFALLLAETLPLRIESRSKAARGFALADREPPGAVKAKRLAFDPETNVDSAMAAVFGSCFSQFLANEPCVTTGTDPEGIHQARVGLRRLRSALSLFRDLLPPEQLQWLKTETRWLAETLGAARDWDVFLEDLLEPVKSAFLISPEIRADLSALDTAARQQRLLAFDALCEALRSLRYTDFQLRFGLWLESRGWRDQPVTVASAALFQPLDKVAGHLLERCHRKVRKAGKHFGQKSYPERHEVRITLKKLRYAAEFFHSLHDAKHAGHFAEQLGTFQDILGHINDVATATRLISLLTEPGSSEGTDAGREQLARAGGVIIGWHGRGLIADEPALISEWREFRATKPYWNRPAGKSRSKAV